MLLICILTTSIFLCACDKGSNTDSTPSGSTPSGEPNDLRDADWIKIYSYTNFSIKPGNYSTVINSVDDIDTLCNETSSPIFENNQKKINGQIIEKLKIYDKEFFETKSLAIIFRLQNGGDYYVKDFEIIEESMTVTVIRETPKGVVYPSVVETYLYLLEFDKEKVVDVTQINVDQITVYV